MVVRVDVDPRGGRCGATGFGVDARVSWRGPQEGSKAPHRQRVGRGLRESNTVSDPNCSARSRKASTGGTASNQNRTRSVDDPAAVTFTDDQRR